MLCEVKRKRYMAYKFTEKQGQYLAFIYYYSKVHRQSPAERDIQEYFRVSAPSIHQMVVTLTDNVVRMGKNGDVYAFMLYVLIVIW